MRFRRRGFRSFRRGRRPMRRRRFGRGPRRSSARRLLKIGYRM